MKKLTKNAKKPVTNVDDGIYEWKFVSGKADPSHSEGGEIAWAEGKMRLANSARNAKFRLGDRVEFRGVKGTVKRVVEGRDGMPTSYKIKGDDGEVYTPSEWDVKYVGNSASLASTNAVVQNAINARRARNAEEYIIDSSPITIFIKRGDKPANDFLSGWMFSGYGQEVIDTPLVRKDLVIRRIEKELNVMKNRVLKYEQAIARLKRV